VDSDIIILKQLIDGTSRGITDNQQKFEVTNQKARYVRIYGNGNSENDWQSNTEVDVYGY